MLKKYPKVKGIGADARFLVLLLGLIFRISMEPRGASKHGCLVVRGASIS